MEKNYNFPVSLVTGTLPVINEKSDILEVLKRATRDEKLKSDGAQLRQLYRTDPAAYKLLKERQPGFIIGLFSHRDVNSCEQYAPFLGFDLDKLGEQYESIINRLKKWPYTVLLLPSVSGQGLRLIVRAESDVDSHKEVYAACVSEISKATNLPTRTAIRASMRQINASPKAISDYLDGTPHIDDSLSDISRVWFFSGLDRSEIFINRESRTYAVKAPADQPAQPAQKPLRNGEYKYEFTDADKARYLVREITRRGVDITHGVAEWFKVGLAIYDIFGDAEGWEVFNKVSSYHSDYNAKSAEVEWRRISRKYQPGRVTAGTFFEWCKRYGLEIDFQELYREVAPIDAQPTATKAAQEAHRPSRSKDRTNKGLRDVEAERCVIAALISDYVQFDYFIDHYPGFVPECFTVPLYRAAFSAMRSLHQQGVAYNLIAVKDRLRHENLEGDIGDVLLKRYYPDSLVTNGRIVFDYHIKRKLESVALETASNINNSGDSAEVHIDSLLTGVQSIGDVGRARSESSAFDLAIRAREEYERMQVLRRENGPNALIGVDTGIQAENLYTGGWRDTDLIILAARPGMGKTAKALKNTLGALYSGVPVAFFSLEMGADQLADRMIALMSGLPLASIKDKSFGGPEEANIYFDALDRFSRLPLYINDEAQTSIEQLSASAARLKREKDIGFVVVDYIQLMGGKKQVGNREQEVSHISRGLKLLAKRLKVPVLALSQLSRAVEIRGGSKCPVLSDLRESGSLEQDADIVQFIYRPEYYQIMEDEEGHSLKGVAELIYAKFRNGSRGVVRVMFDAETTDFFDPGSAFELPTEEPPGRSNPKEPATYAPSIPAVRFNDDEDIPF